MLKRLHISNFALINEMDVSFPGSLTVITGETGAGKSIFLEALSLALGKRAEQGALKNKSKKCIVEAEFDVKGLDLSTFFEENELEPENSITLRREISAEGKSRSFVNDSVISLTALKNLSDKIIDIHSQHQTLLLNQSNFQIELIDAFANSLDLSRNYRQTFRTLTKTKQTLTDLLAQETEARKQSDYLQFLFKELEESNIKAGSLLKLEEESLQLENAEKIRNSLLQAADGLNGNDASLIQQLARMKTSLAETARYGEKYKDFSNRLASVYIELKELTSDIEDAGNDVVADQQRLTTINTQLDKLNSLFRKHGVKTEDELLAVKNQTEEKLASFSSLEADIEKTKKTITTLSTDCDRMAKKLSEQRRKVIPAIELEVRQLLASLSMENANFKIDIQTQEQLGVNGIDLVRFLFSANKGIELSELHKVASGGELSRLMLSLKGIMASRKQLPTIIFDEIDTGVSGDVADKIGNILLKMGQAMQVITITHLPQMASKGTHHLFVYKNDNEDQTVSNIRQLSKEERVVEIAKMLSTSNPTQSALKNAKELLSVN